MTTTRLAVSLFTLAAGGVLAAGLATTSHAQAVRFEGASAGAPFAKVAADAYGRATKGRAVPTFGIAGTAGAFARLCRGEIDLALAVRPMTAAEQAACAKAEIAAVEVPVGLDAVTVVVNPRNSFLKVITLDELKTMWSEASQGRVTRWNQVNPAWPDAPMKLLGAGVGGGDADFFNDAVLGAGNAARRDTMGSGEDSVLVQGIARDVHAVGYVPYAYYSSSRQALRAVPVAAKAGAAGVTPTPETLAKGGYQPLTRTLYLYASGKSLARPEVAAFAEYAVANGAQFARTAQVAPFADTSYRQSVQKLRAGVQPPATPPANTAPAAGAGN